MFDLVITDLKLPEFGGLDVLKKAKSVSKGAHTLFYFIKNFLNLFTKKFIKPEMTISESAYNALLSYDYPGNVRELKHAIERAVILCNDGVIQSRHLPDEIAATLSISPCRKVGMTLESMRCFEKQKIINALLETGGRKIETANKLGISRKVL